MAYTDIATEDLILLAVEFVGRGLEIPNGIAVALGPELVADIQNPETSNARITSTKHAPDSG